MRAWLPLGVVVMFAAAAWPLSAPTEAADGADYTDFRQPATSRIVEMRSYNLKPGTRDRFHQTFLVEALPMLRRWKVDVVGYGP